MDTLDNANNPFAIPNKTNSDAIVTKKDEDLLLNITDGLKKNDDIPNNDLIKMLEKSNCERLTPEFDVDDNLGPETDVDNPEDGSISPNIDVMKRQSETINNNQKFNPFNDIETTLKMNWNLKDGAFDGPVTPSEESCPLPIEPVNNVSQLIDAGGESDSEEEEDEWNYVRGEEANKENIDPLQLNSQVAEEEEVEESDSMSQLNPNAAEFVPVSPIRPTASPLCRLMDDDTVLSQSPKKPPPHEDELNIPNAVDFEKDISQKPHELDEAISNGHPGELGDEMPALNSSHKPDEFHFGPNAAPFTPVKLLDQSEASSTRAQYGDDDDEDDDEEVLALSTSFNVSTFDQQKDDPMSMSFHQDRAADDSNPFDLNKVHVLPDDVDDFIGVKEANKSNNSFMNETISDLSEHFPLGKPQEQLEESKTIPITDLDEHKLETNNVQESNSFLSCVTSAPKLSNEDVSVEANNTPIPEPRLQSPIDQIRIQSPIDEIRIQSPLEDINKQKEDELDRVHSPFAATEDRVSNVEVHKSQSPFDTKEVCSSAEDKDICSLTEDKLLLHLEEQQTAHQSEIKNVCSPFEINSQISDKPSAPTLSELQTLDSGDVRAEGFCLETVQMSATSCDNLESPTASEEPITSELTPDNDVFAVFGESEKADRELAKEIVVEDVLQLDPFRTEITSNNEQCPLPQTTVVEMNFTEMSSNDFLGTVNSSQPAPQEITPGQQLLVQFLPKQEEQIVSSSLLDDKPTSVAEATPSTPPHTPTILEPTQCTLNTSNKSVADTESVTTTDFLDRSRLAEVESPLSPNMSHICLEETMEQVVAVTDIVESPSIIGHIAELPIESPIREPQQPPNVTSTPAAGRPSSIALEQKTSKPMTTKAKETSDKKAPTAKSKVAPTSAVKKTPTPRTSLGASKPTATPSPRTATPRVSAKPSPVPSRLSASKTESAKLPSKPAPPTAAARVPLSSRTTKPLAGTKSSDTNGDIKPAPRTTSASMGAVKKTTEGARSATATGASRPLSSSTRAPLASARNVTSTTAAAKPRPNTLKPAPPKTNSVAALKSTTATSRTATSTAPRIPAAPKTSATSTNRDPKAPITKTFPRPKPTIDKQVKEVANKLTASRTVSRVTSTTTNSTLSKTSTTRKTEDKVSGTKTASRTITSTNANHKPIKRPTSTTTTTSTTEATKTSATKVGKPKENGVAPPVVTEQIIINNAANQQQQQQQLNGGINTNGNQQFVKDNSPVDNKLIVDALTEAAAN